ncbi:phosphoribosyltransferase family protein [Streptococcus fryi]
MNCLLCQNKIESPFRFTPFFLFQKDDEVICQLCRYAFERIAGVRCHRCRKQSEETVCQDCRDWEKKGVIVNHTSFYSYNEAMKHFFNKYKFQGDYLLRKVFSSDFKAIANTFKSYTIVPVPVSKETFEQRGFNQVEGFLTEENISYQTLLIKTESIKQSQLNKQERLKMKNHYELKSGLSLPDKVLLVDDIYTTGATILSIQQLLYEKGVKEVKTFSLAR